MKKSSYIACLVALLMSLSGCEIERSDNGNLDGLWLLSSVDTLATGGVCYLAEEGMTWGFQGHQLSLREATMELLPLNILCSFEKTATTLTLSQPVYNDRRKGDPAVETIDDLRLFGVNSLEEHFTIVALSRSRLVLKTETLQLNLRKM